MPDHTPLDSLLRIDEVRTIERIRIHLRNKLKEQNTDAILLGLSGGIDSCLLSAIAVQAVGKGSVRAAYLYDQHSAPELRRNARLISDWLGIDLKEKSIEPIMREKGVYSSVYMRATSFSGSFNRFLHELYRRVRGESPYISSLRKCGAYASSKNGHSPETQKMGSPLQAGFNARHIYRRRFLEAEAGERNCYLPGAANRTEWLTGWFISGGVDDFPDQPLIGLYKTQIRQLAAFLKIPDSVLTAVPSPDMMKGITDEFALGVSYNRIDAVLDFLEGGLAKEAIMRAGITEKEIRRVEKLKRFSAWKRRPLHAPPPADGGHSGGLRILRVSG